MILVLYRAWLARGGDDDYEPPAVPTDARHGFAF